MQKRCSDRRLWSTRHPSCKNSEGVHKSIFQYFLRSCSEAEISDIRAAWPKAGDAHRDKNCHVNTIHGLISSIIYILSNAKWNPQTSNLWEDSHGATWQIIDWNVSPDIVAAAITNSYFNNNLVKAAEHYNGKGIEEGIDTTNTLRHMRNIKTHTEPDYRYKAVLETIMSGCSWPAARIKSIKYPHTIT